MSRSDTADTADTAGTRTAHRPPAVAERILAAAEELFATHGPAGVGMAEVAEAAGCGRATLYRHFANRRALQVAIAHRESDRILTAVARRVRTIADPHERAVAAVLAALDGVRSRPGLAAWTDPAHAPELLAVLRDSPRVEATAARFVAEDAEPDLETARWLLRCLVSLLAMPPADAAEERRLVERFVVPRRPS